jgi:predicted DNA-binding transcriptional regulator YafY
VRTVYRDLEALSAAGVPVYSEPGRHGGAQLVDGWRTRLTGLTGAEADTLPLLGMPTAAAELGLGTVLAATQAKVLAALPPELRSRAARVAERFHLDAPGWFHRGEQVPCLADLAAAMWDDRRVTIRYRRSDRVVTRTIEPLGLVLKAGTWYLLADHDGQPRTYRVGKVESAEPGERFERPAGFDLARRWEESSEAFEHTMHNVVVRARVREERAWLLRQALDPVAARALAVEPVDADGWVLATFPTESVEVALSHLLQLGAAVEVLDPQALRERIADEASAMADRYTRAPASRAASSR